MSSYVIAGKADDPSFARVEYAAKQIQAACPGVFFHWEMKHPDAWKDFLLSVFRKYDFDGYAEDFAGPLVWTHEGELVGGSAEFVQKVCVEKFGMGNPPSVTDPMFKAMAVDNLKIVQRELFRKANGLPFSERLDAAYSRARSMGLLESVAYEEQRRHVIGGAPLEVWISPAIDEDSQDVQSLPRWCNRRVREEYGATGKALTLSAGLAVTAAGLGAEQTHLVMLHPRPIVRKHLVLAKRRHCRELVAAPESSPVEEAQLSEHAAPADPADGAAQVEGSNRVGVADGVVAETDVVPGAGGEDGVEGASNPRVNYMEIEEGLFDFAPGVEKRTIEVPPSVFRTNPEEDLAEEDFSAAMEAILSIGGIATWVGLRGGTDYRHPLDTHVQVLPFPLHTAGEDCPLRYPLELVIERCLRDCENTVPVFDFNHTLLPLSIGDSRNKVADLAKAALAAFEALRRNDDSSCLVAFTSSWLMHVPLVDPPEPDTLKHQAWLQLPPPHPCALAGVILVEALRRSYPEAAGLELAPGAPFVSNRAILEGIPEGCPEYEAAQKDARISRLIFQSPIELLAVWATR